MAATDASDVKESRLARHMRSKFAAVHSFSADRIQRFTLPVSNVTLAYVVHSSSAAVSAADTKPKVTRVVLLMGYSDSKEEWAPTIDAMMTQWEQAERASTLEILSFDNRGVGGSDAPWGRYSTTIMAEDTLALMDHLEWKQAHIVGLSMGGMIAQELALMAHERVQSLSLVVTSRGAFCPASSAFGAIATSMVSSDPDTVAASVLAILYPTSFLDSTCEVSGKTLRSIVYAYTRNGSAARGDPPVAGSLGQTAALVLHHVSDDRLHTIRDHGYPILIVGARCDVVIDNSHTLYLERVLTGDHVQTVMYDDAGHAVVVQYMDEVARDILGVIARGETL